MIFLDTSGVIALADNTDDFHDRAVQMFESAQKSGEDIVLHNYIVVESAALLQRKLGSDSSIRFLKEASQFNIHWVDSRLHAQAVTYIDQNRTSKMSFVDVMSFLVMRSNKITNFIGFDKHFTDAGFVQYGSKND